MAIDRILTAIKGVQDLVEDGKEHLNNGEYLLLCNATQRLYNCANAIKNGDASSEDERPENDDSEVSDEEEDDDQEEEDAEEPRERTEDDMELNELSDLWECNFDFGRPGAVMELDFLIVEITASVDP